MLFPHTVAQAQTTNAGPRVCAEGERGTAADPCVPSNKQIAKKDPAVDQCKNGGPDCSGIINRFINPFITLISVLVGVMIVIGIVVAGIQYSASGGDPSKIAAAKKRIANALLALLAYMFLFAFLQWLVPGGIA